MPRKKLSSLNHKKVRWAWFNPDWIVANFPCRSSVWMIPAICGLLIILTPACTESDLVKDDNPTGTSPPTFENLALDSAPFVKGMFGQNTSIFDHVVCIFGKIVCDWLY